MKKKKIKPFDKYEYYFRAVQSPEIDCDFITRAYREIRGKSPRVLREDFCGTFAVCCEWARRHKLNRAIGIDLDQEPINYGRANNLTKIRPAAQKRVNIVLGSVLTAKVPAADIILALNFSFNLFKSRSTLRTYFKQALKGLKSKGVLMVDCFGGPDVQEANEEATKHRGFTYFWDQTNFNPVTHEALFHIHFKREGEKRREKVFTYDWRIWTIPEIREIMIEAGFRRTYAYWEGSNRAGSGDGKFKKTEVGEECDGWIAYVIGEA